MANLAIKGHETRGNEVIEILEMLGGKNERRFNGENNCLWHYIDERSEISVFTHVFDLDDFIFYNLEEFFEKYPYKVGDKVQHKDATSCGSVFEIEKIRWVNNDVEYTVKRLWYNNCHTTFTTKDLQPYKEETMENKLDLLQQLKDYFDNTPREVVEKEWHEYDKYNEIGPTVNEYLEYVNKIRQPQYPKTFVECCEILYPNENFQTVSQPIKGHNGKKLFVLQKLLICRDTYWKIAGDWKYDVNKTEEYFYIVNKCGRIVKEHYMNFNHILAFPTEETRDAFYENFKELIEECKEFL